MTDELNISQEENKEGYFDNGTPVFLYLVGVNSILCRNIRLMS